MTSKLVRYYRYLLRNCEFTSELLYAQYTVGLKVPMLRTQIFDNDPDNLSYRVADENYNRYFK